MFSNIAAQQSQFDQIVSWSNIVSAAVAVVVVILGIWVATTAYQTLALVNRRRRRIGPVVRKMGMCASRRHFIRTSWSLLSDRARGGSPQVREELTWLSEINSSRLIESELPGSGEVPIPFTFGSRITSNGYTATLVELANAYDSYASSVRRRWVLRSAAGPLVAEEYECAKATARLLRRWASFEPISSTADPDGMRGRVVKLASENLPRSIRLVTWPDMKSVRATPAFPVIGASYQLYRVEMDGSPAHDVRTKSLQVRFVPDVLDIAASNPLDFDGVLPRWHGPGFRMEIDRITGRQKLHLCLAETTYYAVKATQLPEAAKLAGDDALRSRLLSLNLLMLDQHDIVLLIRRSDYVVYPGCFAGTVAGNCELVSREGLTADLDQYGLPDLLAAISREASEELGLDLKPAAAQLAALGIIEYSGETELSTHALIATAFMPGHARDFRIDRMAPDPVEGLWEIGDQFMTIDLAKILRDRSAGYRFVMWLRTAQELAPQGAGALLLLLTARVELLQQQATRKYRSFDTASWTTSDLSRWLDEPTPGSPVNIADIVGFHPLWK
jgi:hypothetical protein